MTTLVNIKERPTPLYDLYIGRANKWLNLAESKWHNPFPMKNEGMREVVVHRYFNYLHCSQELLEALHEIDNLILGCYCHNRLCHGDVLINTRKLQIEFHDVWPINHMSINDLAKRVIRKYDDL